MAQYNRPPKRKKKGPDEFISFFDHIVRYFEIHQKKLILLVVAGVIAFAGYGIYLYRQNKRVKDFAVLYQEALKASPEDSLRSWQEILKKDPPLKLEDVIAIQIGGIYARKQDWINAATEFNKAGDSDSELLRFLGQWAGAVSLENSGSWEKAYSEYQKISEEAANPFKDNGRLGMARCLLGLGKISEAETLLNQLVGKDSEVSPSVKAAAMNKLLVMRLPPPTPQNTK